MLHEKGNARTFGSLRESFWKFFDSGESSNKAKEFGNSLHSPIFRCSDEIHVVEKFPPPELHLMIGVVNTLFKELLKNWDNAQLWLELCHIEREFYHGGSFTGNSAKKLLKNISKLEEIAEGVSMCYPFIDAFKCFNKVVDSCFGMKLDDDYENNIEAFRLAFQRLGIRITPKVHIVFFHVIEFCNKFIKGLGYFSEQASESVHYDFNACWEKFKVHSTHRDFGSHLFNAVSRYNAQHL